MYIAEVPCGLIVAYVLFYLASILIHDLTTHVKACGMTGGEVIAESEHRQSQHYQMVGSFRILPRVKVVYVMSYESKSRVQVTSLRCSLAQNRLKGVLAALQPAKRNIGL